MRISAAGFTLVEMLVVIAIIAVLVSILLPVFLKAQSTAYTARCASNLRQLAQAVRMYADDNDRRLPPARTYLPGNDTLGETWCVTMQPYIRSGEIIVCPTDSAPQLAMRSTDLPHSYGINYLLTFNATWDDYPMTASLSSLNALSNLIIFFDLKSTSQTMGSSYTAQRVSQVAGRHNGRACFSFLDGHAKAMPVSAVDSPAYWNPFGS